LGFQGALREAAAFDGTPFEGCLRGELSSRARGQKSRGCPKSVWPLFRRRSEKGANEEPVFLEVLASRWFVARMFIQAGCFEACLSKLLL
jgi:hypothetical protein